MKLIGLDQVRKALDGSMEARDQQIEDASKIIDSEENIVLQRPVGTGKTETTIQAMIGNALEAERNGEDYKAVIAVPRTSLRSQWKSRLEEYNLDDLFDIEINEPKSSFSNYEEISEFSSALKNSRNGSEPAMGAKTRHSEEKELVRHKEKVFGVDNVFPDKNSVRNNLGVSNDGANIIITTYHTLDEDIKNGNVQLGDVGINDVIIDEATVMESRDEFQNRQDDEQHHGGFNVAKRFRSILGETMGESNYIALTAFPGRKLPFMLDDLGASLISPNEDDLTESMANVDERYHRFNVETKEEDVFQKERNIVSHRLTQIENTLDNFRKELKGKVKNKKGKVGNASPFAYANSNDEELHNAAVKALSFENKAQMIYEGGLELLEDEFQDPLPENYEDPKVEGLRDMVEDWEQKDENYVIFTSHKETAEYLNQQIGDIANSTVVDGDQEKDQNEEALENFGENNNGIFMTYGYGSEGIDLPEGDHIVHLSDQLDPELKQSSTGRAKRGEDIEEHTLLYDFEEKNPFLEEQFIEEDGMYTNPETRARLRYMLNPDTDYDDLIREEKMQQAETDNGHLLNTPPQVDS